MKYDIKKNYNLNFNYLNKGLSGLSNLGNTCFVNSVLQCLSNSLGVTEYFLKEQFKKEDPDGHHQYRKEYSIVLCYTDLLRNMWETNTILKPRSLLVAMTKMWPKWTLGTQQDSHECLMQLLDLLHQGICYEIEVDIKGEIVKESDRLMVNSILEWRRHFEKNYSIIIDSFYGMTTNSITCSNCNTLSRTFEPFSTINLSIPNSDTTLVDCLKNYFNSDSQIEDYHCEQDDCKKTGSCSKQTKLWMLPNYVIITFKRFNNKNKKITTKIDFTTDRSLELTEPFELDLTPYVSLEKEDPNRYIYSLYAVNCHTGDTAGGHYYSYIKNLDGNFYMMNDANVNIVNQATSICSENAYILFYYRKFISA